MRKEIFLSNLEFIFKLQQKKNKALLSERAHLNPARVVSSVLPFQIDIRARTALTTEEVTAWEALQIEAARIAIRSAASLAEIGEIDGLGGALEAIPPLLLSVAISDHQRITHTFEHAHTCLGYYSILAALGYLEQGALIDTFRRGIEFPGHTAWLPGGTELSGGRLGVIIPVAVGEALGKRAEHGEDAWTIVHCGDAGWLSGQALNGFAIAARTSAPITFVMHRNGIQHTGPTRAVFDLDPRRIIETLGIQLVEIPSLLMKERLYEAYREASALARSGRPALVYPTGFKSTDKCPVTLRTFGEMHGVMHDIEAYAAKHNVSPDTEVWIPGSVMSYRDTEAMIQCLFFVNSLPGGQSHHDGHMIGRDVEKVLSSHLIEPGSEHRDALRQLRESPRRKVVTEARPQPGTPNLALPAEVLKECRLPSAGSRETPRTGAAIAYEALARIFPESIFVVSCDLDISTKLMPASNHLDQNHHFQVGVQEQAGALLANGLCMAGHNPKLVVISSYAAFFEGIAREGFEFLRYQRNLNGVNEGLNITWHLSHVGSATGRDHFSGWGLDWINIALTYLPYLDRFYCPPDAISAFLAVRDLASRYGAHIIGLPREDFPVLSSEDGSPFYTADGDWAPMSLLRSSPDAGIAVLAVGATAEVGLEVFNRSHAHSPIDLYVVNGLPVGQSALRAIISTHRRGIVTIEDGLIGVPESGIRGFAGVVSSAADGSDTPLRHFGITDPRVAPSAGGREVWEHFGLTADDILEAVADL